MFRIFNFVFTVALVLSSNLYAMHDERDLVIAAHLSPCKKRILFEKVVHGAIPGKGVPDPYHITLGIVQNVKLGEIGLLGDHLDSLARIYLTNATFTATAAKRYLVNRTPNLCPLVLAPTAAETNTFKNINVVLHNALQAYNVHQGKHYAFAPDVLPAVYDPHITLVDTHYIQSHALDRDVLLQRMNARIHGKGLEFLQRPHHRPPHLREGHKGHAGKHKQAARRHGHEAHKHKRAAHRHKRAASRHKAAGHRHRAARHRKAAAHHRHVAASHKRAATQHKRMARRHRRG